MERRGKRFIFALAVDFIALASAPSASEYALDSTLPILLSAIHVVFLLSSLTLCDVLWKAWQSGHLRKRRTSAHVRLLPSAPSGISFSKIKVTQNTTMGDSSISTSNPQHHADHFLNHEICGPLSQKRPVSKSDRSSEKRPRGEKHTLLVLWSWGKAVSRGLYGLRRSTGITTSDIQGRYA